MKHHIDRFRGGLVSGTARGFFAVALMGLLMAGAGCRSTSGGSDAGFASVVIHGNTPGQVLQMAEQVFVENQYVVALEGPNRLCCEKKASGMSNVAYGNWMAGSPLWQRVRVAAVPLSEAVVKLQCQAYYVRGRGETVEEELPISKLRNGPYEKLLKETARRLGGTP
jgi:hypothetical protein